MTRRKPYVRPMSGWWRANPYFLRYMLREGTSVLVGAYCAVLVWGLLALASGPDTWVGWVLAMGSPASMAFHLAVLAAGAYHTMTWFAVAPKTMPPVRLGSKPVPASLIVAAQYAGAAVVTLVIVAAVWSGP